MFVGTRTFENTVKRLDKEIVTLKAKVATLEKLAAKVTKKVTELDKLPKQVTKLETTRRLWPLQDYSTGE
jgi:prefoldin subunit 5